MDISICKKTLDTLKVKEVCVNENFYSPEGEVLAEKLCTNVSVINCTTRDEYAVLRAAAAIFNRAEENADSAPSPVNMDGQSDELYESMFMPEDDDDCYGAGELMRGQRNCSTFIVITETDLKARENDSMEGRIKSPISAPNSQLLCGLQNILILCDECNPFSEQLFETLEGLSANIILMMNMQKISKEANLHLLVDLNATVLGNLEAPSSACYADILARVLKSQGISISDNSALENVEGLKRIRGDSFSGLDVFRFADRIMQKKPAQVKENAYEEEYNIKRSDSAIKEVEAMIGCEVPKRLLKEAISTAIFFNERKKNALSFREQHNNILLIGNPGSGKTTFAKAYSEALAQAGITNGKHKTIGREDVVGQYLGQSTHRTLKLLNDAKGGCVFFDEVSSLLSYNRQDNYSNEIVSVLVRFQEENPDTTFIYATYPNEAEQFLALDPGLSSRIKMKIEFKDYTAQELTQIFFKILRDDSFEVRNRRACEALLNDYFAALKKDVSFGNGRAARNLAEETEKQFALSYTAGKKSLTGKITPSEISRAIESYRSLSELPVRRTRIGF